MAELDVPWVSAGRPRPTPNFWSEEAFAPLCRAYANHAEAAPSRTLTLDAMVTTSPAPPMPP
jgi:hypothetical protein